MATAQSLHWLTSRISQTERQLNHDSKPRWHYTSFLKTLALPQNRNGKTYGLTISTLCPSCGILNAHQWQPRGNREDSEWQGKP